MLEFAADSMKFKINGKAAVLRLMLLVSLARCCGTDLFQHFAQERDSLVHLCKDNSWITKTISSGGAVKIFGFRPRDGSLFSAKGALAAAENNADLKDIEAYDEIEILFSDEDGRFFRVDPLKEESAAVSLTVRGYQNILDQFADVFFEIRNDGCEDRYAFLNEEPTILQAAMLVERKVSKLARLQDDQSVFGIRFDWIEQGRVRVTHVDEHSVAHRGGLEVGDVIIAARVDCRPAELREAIELISLRKLDRLELTIVRNEEVFSEKFFFPSKVEARLLADP